MPPVKCLYLENQPEQQQRFKRRLEIEWAIVAPNSSLDITPVSTPEEAAEKLGSEDFHLFVVDILLGSKGGDEPLGLAAISDARTAKPDLAIVVLTIAGERFRIKATEAGADDVVSKDDVLNYPKRNILGTSALLNLRKWRHDPSLCSVDILKMPHGNIRLSALVETVERQNIVNCVVEILGPHVESIRPDFVRSGLSGASVIRAECQMAQTADGPRRRDLLLKFTRDLESATAEVQKNVAVFPRGLFVPFIRDNPVSSGGWYCLATDFMGGCKTLLDWLCQERPSSEHVEKVMSGLFLSDGLAETYSNVTHDDRNSAHRNLWNAFSPSRRARVIEALDDLGSLARKYDSGTHFDRKHIERFISESKRVADLDEEAFPPSAVLCPSHGDLHGRNILVDHNQLRAFLIDRGSIVGLHWASDMARLAVDFIVSGWDSDTSSHEWDSMDKWLNLVGAFLGNTLASHPAPQMANAALFTALRWLRERLFDVHPQIAASSRPDWEFLLAVAIEFMRASYRRLELPTPKRVLGLLSACLALGETATEFEEWRNTLGH